MLARKTSDLRTKGLILLSHRQRKQNMSRKRIEVNAGIIERNLFSLPKQVFPRKVGWHSGTLWSDG